MGVLTETELRRRLRAKDLAAMREYRVQPGTVITPSARGFLAEHKIELTMGEPATAPATPETGGNGNLPDFTPPERYRALSGGYYDEKPEHMTALRGTDLVEKDHPVIRLRGRLDSLEAEVIAAQAALEQGGRDTLAAELDEVRAFVHELLRCEVLDTPLPETPLLGMHGDEIRAHSHFPGKYYGVQHFGASRADGAVVAVLNRLRTGAREVELVAYDAFKQRWGPPRREDILRGLNRLSSLFYVLMLREKSVEGGKSHGPRMD